MQAVLWDIALTDQRSILFTKGTNCLIHKVNRPSYLSVVPQPKKMENDPGSSQGSGNLYEGSSHPDSEKQKPSQAPPETETATPELEVVVNVEQMGMTEVVTDFLEQKKGEAHVNPGLSVRYTTDSQTAKGLLLNKKAE